MLALWLEHKYSKDEILELYLNRVYFGSGAYGVEGGGAALFRQIGAQNVTLAEAAMLAGLVQVAVAAGAEPQPRRRERARAAIVLAAMAEPKLHHATPGAKLALGHPAHVVKPRGAGSDQLRRRLDVMDVLDDLIGHDRPGHRGRDHDRSDAAGRRRSRR